MYGGVTLSTRRIRVGHLKQSMWDSDTDTSVKSLFRV